MKKIAGVVALAAVLTGCVSENGIHFVELNVADYKYDPVTHDPIPSFRVVERKPEIADQGRASLLGKWRVVVNCDLSGKSIGGCYARGEWEIDVYEFKDDGTYEMRRVAEDLKTTLGNSGEDGRWSYANGILKLRPSCAVMPGLFPFSEPKRVDVEGGATSDGNEAPYEFRVKWHTRSVFTQEYADLEKVKAVYEIADRKMRESLGLLEYSTSNIHYDAKGCLHQQSYWNDGRVKSYTFSVTNPKVFRRINE